MPWTRTEIARRAAHEILPESVVNLGIGIPTLVAQYLDPARGIVVQSENGLLGVGAYPLVDEVDADLINAAKETVTLNAGGSSFDSSLSFGMIRGGRVDVAVLGAMQVSMAGDLANWTVPGEVLTGIGGAMDLALGAGVVIVTAMHRTPSRKSKLVERCSIPLTASGVVNLVITELGVLQPAGDCFILRSCAPGVSVTDIVAATSAPIVDRSGAQHVSR